TPPEPGDVACGCSTRKAGARRARGKCVASPRGDVFPAAAAGFTHKPMDQVGPDDFLALSRLRETQSRTALEILGGQADDLIVFGYPDSDLGNLYDSTDDKVFLSVQYQ